MNISEWLLQAAKINVKTVSVAGSDFELMTLTDDHIDEASACESLAELFEFAATYGLSANSVRAIDLKGMTDNKIKALWQMSEFEHLDPSIVEQVGLVVCEMSDIMDIVKELTPEEFIDGDNLPEGAELGDLQSSMNADTQAYLQSAQ